jgi:hypothetical protein
MMKEYTYEVEHHWEKQRRPVAVDHQHRRQLRQRCSGHDADASSISGKYKHLYSIVSLYVYSKLNDKKNCQLFAGIYTHTPIS